MRLLSRFEKQPPPTATDLLADEKAAPLDDIEKKANEIDTGAASNERHVVPHIERRVVRKMDFRIVPLVTALYVLAFLDRSNICLPRCALGLADR